MKYPGIVASNKLNDDTKLYRYINLKQLMSIIENRQIYLTKIKKWENTWELPAGKLPALHDNGELSYPIWSIDEIMYGSCWSLHEESDALWRIYSPNLDGIRIQTSVKKFNLLKEIRHGFLAPVIYYENLLTALREIDLNKEYRSPFSRAFLKRIAFQHEKEVRLVTINDERCITLISDNNDFINFDINPFEFIENIIIDPRADDWYVELLKKYCARAGFTFEPSKSKLYDPDVYNESKIVIQFIPVDSKE